MDMKDISWENEFDGVWAMASLLHLEKKDFPHILKKVINSVKEDGYLFISLKQGVDSGYDEKGRYFSYYQKEELENILKEMNVENTIPSESVLLNFVKLNNTSLGWIVYPS